MFRNDFSRGRGEEDSGWRMIGSIRNNKVFVVLVKTVYLAGSHVS